MTEIKQKRPVGRPRKTVARNEQMKDDEIIDTGAMTRDQIALQLRNKIFTLAMKPDPHAQILMLATKVFDIEITNKSSAIEELSSEEIMARLKATLE